MGNFSGMFLRIIQVGPICDVVIEKEYKDAMGGSCWERIDTSSSVPLNTILLIFGNSLIEMYNSLPAGEAERVATYRGPGR